jgi:hypothetical protein
MLTVVVKKTLLDILLADSLITAANVAKKCQGLKQQEFIM